MGKSNDKFLTIGDLWHLCYARWWWFAASVSFCLLLAVRHILTAPYLYSRSASIMVHEDLVGNNVTDKNSKDFTELGFVKQKSNLTDVLRHIKSLEVLMEVAYRSKEIKTPEEALSVAQGIQGRLSVESSAEKSNIIDMTYQDSSTSEAERILSFIIEVYNEKWIHDKQEIIRSTSRFIDSKLNILESELNTVDDSISSYKSRYGITEIENVSNIYLQQQSQTDAEMLRLSNQKAMAQYIRGLLEDETTQQQLLLVNSGINNTLIESQITLYNSLLLQMQSHMEYTSGQNPLIMNLEKELKSLRKNILSNVINHIRTIDIHLQSLENYHSETTSKISSNPKQAKHLLSIEREQKVKESLYMFLLQKKEENEISLTYQSSPTQIIDMPHGSGKPTSPKRVRALFVAVLLGFLMPLAVIFFRAAMDDTVRDRGDVEHSDSIPYLGETPLLENGETLLDQLKRSRVLKYLKRFLRIGKEPDVNLVVVAHDKQDRVNEAFRILRTRLQLIVNNPVHRNVYLVTSTESGDGKTFISMNLALALAIEGKRVMFIDGNLRNGTASSRWKAPSHGLSDYLDGRVMEPGYIFFQPEGYPTLDVLPSGTIPLHPTELLNSKLMGELISSARPNYDYIFIDTPPIGKLADAEIISKYADHILYVIRAGKFKCNDLEDLKKQEGQIESRYIIINGV